MRLYLFVGGPWDGQRREADNARGGLMQVHEPLPSNDPPDLPLNLCARPRYKSSFYRSTPWCEAEFFVHESLSLEAAVAALLENYRPLSKSEVAFGKAVRDLHELVIDRSHYGQGGTVIGNKWHCNGCHSLIAPERMGEVCQHGEKHAVS